VDKKENIKGKKIPKCFFNKNVLLLFGIPAFIFILDRVFKNIVFNGFSNSNVLLRIHYVINTGVSWGLFKGNSSLMLWLSIIIIGILMYFYNEITSIKDAKLGLNLIIIGAISNILDRIFFGHVIDYIDFSFFPVFNLGDACITLGAVCIILVYVFDDRKTNKLKNISKK